MITQSVKTPRPGGCPLPHGSAREEQRRRNAAARRKLEALRDNKLLLSCTTDVRDAPESQHYT
jgi:hypothetical protein